MPGHQRALYMCSISTPPSPQPTGFSCTAPVQDSRPARLPPPPASAPPLPRRGSLARPQCLRPRRGATALRTARVLRPQTLRLGLPLPPPPPPHAFGSVAPFQKGTPGESPTGQHPHNRPIHGSCCLPSRPHTAGPAARAHAASFPGRSPGHARAHAGGAALPMAAAPCGGHANAAPRNNACPGAVTSVGKPLALTNGRAERGPEAQCWRSCSSYIPGGLFGGVSGSSARAAAWAWGAGKGDGRLLSA
jgi:hypothetical protein